MDSENGTERTVTWLDMINKLEELYPEEIDYSDVRNMGDIHFMREGGAKIEIQIPVRTAKEIIEGKKSLVITFFDVEKYEHARDIIFGKTTAENGTQS